MPYSRRCLRASLTLLALFALAGCSNPNVRKDKYLKSGKDYIAHGRYEEAVVQLRNAIDVDPKFAAAHLELARAYLNLNSRREAFRELQQVLVLDPQNREAKLELAPLLIAGREYDKADALIREVLKDDPRNSQAHAILARRYTETKNLPNAVREIQAAIEIEPRPEYYSALGALDLASGNASEAEAAYKNATARDPKSVQAHVALGQFYFSQRRISRRGGGDAYRVRTGFPCGAAQGFSWADLR